MNDLALPDNHKKILKHAFKNIEIGIRVEFKFESIDLAYEAMKIVIKDSKRLGFEVKIELIGNSLYVFRIK